MSNIATTYLVPDGQTRLLTRVSQYDVGREIHIYIENQDNTTYEISDEAVCTINALKSDGNIYSTTLEHGDDYLILTTEEQLTCISGKVLCEIRIAENGADIGTANFYLIVENSPIDQGLESESVIASLAAYVTKASEAAADAQTAAEAANDSAEDAETYATQAKTYASNAATSATGAASSASEANTSASNASSSASSASTSATNAATSATNAASSESSAKTYASNAATSATSAASSASSASTSESNAKTYASNASESANDASDSATLSESWAIGGTGTRTGEDSDNSMYYAEQAAEVLSALESLGFYIGDDGYLYQTISA